MANHVDIKVGGDATGFHSVLTGVNSSVKSFAGSLKGQLAAAFSVGAIGVAAHSILEFGDSIQTMANNLDVSTDSAQKFQWAMRNSNVQVSALTKTLNGLEDARERALGGDEQKGALLKQLGFTQKDLKTKPKEELFTELLKNSTNRGKTENVLSQLGVGRRISGAVLGAKDDFLNKNIPIVPPDMISKLDSVGDTMGNIATILKTALIPAFLTASEAILKFAENALNWYQKGVKDEDTLLKLQHIGVTSESGFKREELYKLNTIYDRNFSPEQTKGIDSILAERNNAVDSGAIQKIRDQIGNLIKDLDKKPEERKKVPFVPTAIPVEKTPVNLGELSSNEYLKIGSGLGINIQYRMERLTYEALAYHKRTAEAVESINEKMSGGSGGDDFPDS